MGKTAPARGWFWIDPAPATSTSKHVLVKSRCGASPQIYLFGGKSTGCLFVNPQKSFLKANNNKE
jgi:hypothetical protein